MKRNPAAERMRPKSCPTAGVRGGAKVIARREGDSESSKVAGSWTSAVGAVPMIAPQRSQAASLPPTGSATSKRQEGHSIEIDEQPSHPLSRRERGRRSFAQRPGERVADLLGV